MNSPHPLDILFAQARQPQVEIPTGWGQGRATFGGLVGGLIVARALAAYDLDPLSLRSMTTSFVAPLRPGPARATAELLRAGSSATQVLVRIDQSPQEGAAPAPCAVGLLSFGRSRDSAVELPAPAATAIPDPATTAPIPFIAGLTPDFMAQVELRLVTGGLPYSGAATGEVTGFMGFRQPPQRMTLAHFVALVDAWPPAPAQLLSGPAGMSTLAWTLELLALPGPDPDADFWYAVRSDSVQHGYGHTHALVHDRAGTPLAISRQTISLFG